ncbi:Elongation factor 4 [Weissella viridescens]|uniref:Elongation factor 4 n=1 Tax=Weissella viridescens TaxID=1629 RepID=A0A380P2Z2_WEIVI|nr:Elongation factor 4 [Weissella viridescens]
MPKDQKFIRNFAIIAHIDHGKSTLADRIMETTNTVSNREASDQLLDDLAVEQMHGVTVKSRTVRNYYVDPEGQEFEYNLIDTPGHVDFNYEVSRSLSATDGVLLLVDATKGVQAQTVANYRLSQDAGLTVIPIINKIDNKWLMLIVPKPD